jgi:hypothetical protein
MPSGSGDCTKIPSIASSSLSVLTSASASFTVAASSSLNNSARQPASFTVLILLRT